MIKDVQAVLDRLEDVPDWEKDPDNPAWAIAHQELISLMSNLGLRSLMWDRVRELLAKHDNWKDFFADLCEVQDEILDDLQRALHGTAFGAELMAHEQECSVTLTALRKGNP